MLSVSDREKLLRWDAADASEEGSSGLVSAGGGGGGQVDVIQAAPSVIPGKTELTQDVVVLFISGFLPSAVSLSGPKTGTQIRTLNSTLCRAAFFPLSSDVLSGGRRDPSR